MNRMRHMLCTRQEVADPGSRAFVFTQDGQTVEVLVVHWRGQWFAYRNACPHTGVNLNWSDDNCFDLAKRYLICSLHGALFEPDSGRCVYGPCLNQALSTLTLQVDGESVYLLYDNKGSQCGTC